MLVIFWDESRPRNWRVLLYSHGSPGEEGPGTDLYSTGYKPCPCRMIRPVGSEWELNEGAKAWDRVAVEVIGY